METEPQEIVESWYKLAEKRQLGEPELDNIFLRFVAIWMAFNGFYTEWYTAEFNKLQGDRKQVIAFSKNVENSKRHVRWMRADRDYRSAVHILKEKEVFDSRENNRVRRIENELDLEQVLLCVYLVRCNLFHGGKTPTNPRDENLVAASHTLVSRFVETYLENEGDAKWLP